MDVTIYRFSQDGIAPEVERYSTGYGTKDEHWKVRFQQENEGSVWYLALLGHPDYSMNRESVWEVKKKLLVKSNVDAEGYADFLCATVTCIDVDGYRFWPTPDLAEG